MEKISSSKVATVLSAVPGMLRTLSTERDSLLTKVASLETQVRTYQRQARVDSLAKLAEDKGIDAFGESHEEKVATIENALERGKSLDVMEEAIKMSSIRGDLAGLVGDEITGQGGGSETTKSQLEGYLLGGLE